MKATHNKVKETRWKFPCLGIRETGVIVLFTDKGIGTCIVGTDNSYEVGVNTDNWAHDEFQPLPSTESVTLQND
jgi:hypothetical protein